MAIVSTDGPVEIELNDDDLKIEWFSGTGKGGQHRNKHQNSCRVLHVPTGLQESRQGRHRESNLRDAKSALKARLAKLTTTIRDKERSLETRSQVGSGMRGDKTITIRLQDDRVQNHITGKSMKASKYMKGFMNLIW